MPKLKHKPKMMVSADTAAANLIRASRRFILIHEDGAGNVRVVEGRYRSLREVAAVVKQAADYLEKEVQKQATNRTAQPDFKSSAAGERPDEPVSEEKHTPPDLPPIT